MYVRAGPCRKVSFHTNDQVWTFRKHKGRKFCYGTKQLWHAWDRPKEEVLLSKRVSLAIKVLHTRAVERGILCNGAEMGIDGDGERGRVWFKRYEDSWMSYISGMRKQCGELDSTCSRGRGVRTCGAANDKQRCALKTSERIRKFPPRLGEGSLLVNPVHARIDGDD